MNCQCTPKSLRQGRRYSSRPQLLLADLGPRVHCAAEFVNPDVSQLSQLCFVHEFSPLILLIRSGAVVGGYGKMASSESMSGSAANSNSPGTDNLQKVCLSRSRGLQLFTYDFFLIASCSTIRWRAACVS